MKMQNKSKAFFFLFTADLFAFNWKITLQQIEMNIIGQGYIEAHDRRYKTS